MASLSTKSITLGPGDCVILPRDAVITSVIINGAITASSSCNNLPTPTTYVCGVFYLFASVSSDDAGPLDEENTYYNSVTIGGTTYDIGEKVLQGDNPGTLTDISVLNSYITDSGIFQFTGLALAALTDRQRIAVYFQVPADLFDETYLQISDRGTLYNLPPYEAACDEYPSPE